MVVDKATAPYPRNYSTVSQLRFFKYHTASTGIQGFLSVLLELWWSPWFGMNWIVHCKVVHHSKARSVAEKGEKGDVSLPEAIEGHGHAEPRMHLHL